MLQRGCCVQCGHCVTLQQRRNYSWVGNALTRVAREEGVATLWRGCGPTIGRAVVLNIAQVRALLAV